MDVGGLFIDLKWLLVFLTTCVLLIYLKRLFKTYSYWENYGIPYAKPLLIIGNLSFVMRKSAWDFFDELRQNHPVKYVGIYLGHQPALVVQTPELARTVLLTDMDYFEDRYLYCNANKDPLGSLNLFVLKNPIWHDMRHHISPMFTSSRLKMLTQLMNINSQHLVRKIKRDYIDKNKLIDLKEVLTMYTSDTVAYTVFGLRVSALDGMDSPLWVISRHIVKWTFRRGLEFTTIFFLPYIAKFLRLKFFSAQATEYVKQLFWNVAKNRKADPTNDRDLVNHLLKLKENLKLPAGSDTELADNLMLAQAAVFILGSVETSSTTITYCLHELAHHPEAQEKLYNEVNDALKKTGKEILEYDDLVELKYLSACLYETLRKYPPVPYLDRITAKPYELDGIKLEAGLPVFVNVVAIHRNPKIYSDPERWDPCRPLPNSDNDNMNSTFLPFGEGPRFCIGKRYGMMQMRTALAQIIKAYRIEPGPVPYDVKSDPYSVILAPNNGGCVKFVAR